MQIADPADILKNHATDTAPPKDPADILQRLGPEALQKVMKCYINDFDYLLNRAKTSYNIRDSGGKASAIAFLFPYIRTLESEVSRDECIEAASIAIGTTKAAILNDLRQSNSGLKPRQTERGAVPENRPVILNDELFLLMTVTVNYMSGNSGTFFTDFRKNLGIRDIEDSNAKELYIALEECIIRDEIGIDYLLSRISSPSLKKFYLERGTSGEFSINPAQVIKDGLKKTDQKKLERKLEELILKLKTLKTGTGNEKEMEELLADKIVIDEKLRRLKEV